MSVRWAVGIDGGGTKTAAAARLIDRSGDELSSVAGPCNIAAMQVDESFANVLMSIEKLAIAPDDIIALCIGVAGYSATENRVRFTEYLTSYFGNAAVLVVPDYLIAHASAFQDTVGVTVIAGTGSIAYGENAAGESAVCGGFGYLIDDKGSGYGMGREILAEVGRVFDRSASKSYLVQLFIERTGIQSREELISAVYGGKLDRPRIAALAQLVSEAAAQGDGTAHAILMHAGGALAKIAQGAISRLFRPDESITVCKAGSLWAAGEELNAVFERSLRRSFALVMFQDSTAPPVSGALALAQRHLPTF